MKMTDIIAIIALSGMAGWFGYNLFLSTANQPAYDPETFCQKNVPSKETVLLVDPSTRFDRIQKARLRDLEAHLLRQGLSPNAHLSLYRLQETVTQPPVPEFDGCYPAAGNGAVQRRMRRKFTEDLKEALAVMMTAKQEKSSPLIEGLAALSASDQWKPENAAIVIYGDMIQNTGLLNQYDHEITAERFMRLHRGYFQEHPLNLRGAHVYIFLLDRLPLTNTRIERHKRFWAMLLGKQGHAGNVSFCTLDGRLKRHCQKGWPL